MKSFVLVLASVLITVLSATSNAQSNNLGIKEVKEIGTILRANEQITDTEKAAGSVSEAVNAIGNQAQECAIKVGTLAQRFEESADPLQGLSLLAAQNEVTLEDDLSDCK